MRARQKTKRHRSRARTSGTDGQRIESRAATTDSTTDHYHRQRQFAPDNAKSESNLLASASAALLFTCSGHICRQLIHFGPLILSPGKAAPRAAIVTLYRNNAGDRWKGIAKRESDSRRGREGESDSPLTMSFWLHCCLHSSIVGQLTGKPYKWCSQLKQFNYTFNLLISS